MAKSIFSVSSSFESNHKSILQVSVFLVRIIKQLSLIDDSFNSPIHCKEGFKDEQLDINKPEIVEQLSQLILETNKSDIKQHEKEENPTTDFSRDFGFHILFNFKLGNKEVFSITSVVGATKYEYIKVEYFNRDFEHSQNWYESVLKCLVNETNSRYASINIILSTFNDLKRPLNIKQPFGWFTYFSNDNEIQIPDDLEGVEYEHTEEGKYVILTRDDFTVSKEAYEVQRDRLLAIMKEVKERVPEYSL
ncbi:hypothetical protein U6A24_16675 [Aquimarina gracilis]|uniref:Immunity protein 26 of polymorphic toxin system n=1 Tax=Aquimarina gracilis TaxID=874422 RepID=A0ABU5ZYW7_9FLAO|nr:hypothetical protein [Aquimarina gracilis]MEB3347110.1 hypothetical protein [Aquimarina gracilis]